MYRIVEMQDGVGLYEPLTPETMGDPLTPPSRQIDATRIVCGALRQGDEAYCPACGLRWGVGDNRPECPN
jgi:hypothetical protein